MRVQPVCLMRNTSSSAQCLNISALIRTRSKTCVLSADDEVTGAWKKLKFTIFVLASCWPYYVLEGSDVWDVWGR